MITVWTKVKEYKVLSCLSPVLKNCLDLPLGITEEFKVFPDTKIILGLGAHALDKLKADKVVAKNLSLSSQRNKMLSYWGTPLMVSFSPDIGEIDWGSYVHFLTDAASAIRFHHTGSLEAKLGQYRWVEDFSEFVEQVKLKAEATQRPVDVTLDLEWVGDNPYIQPSLTHPGSYIVSIQLTHTKGFSDCVRFPSNSKQHELLKPGQLLWEQFNWLLTSKQVKLRGANLKGDLQWIFLHASGIECTNFCFDTTIVGSLLDENRSNSLDVHAKIYVPDMGGYSDEFDATTDKTRMDLVPPAKLLPYAGADTDACHQIADIERAELIKNKPLTTFYVNILHPASRAFEKIERTGVLVDKQAMNELSADLDKEMLECIKEAKSILGGHIVAKHYDDTKLGGLNLTKASLLTDFFFSPKGLNLKPKMFTEKSKAPSTSADHIVMFENACAEAGAFVKVFKRFGKADHVKNTYVTGFMQHLRPDDRFHPWYFLYAGNQKGNEDEGGTVTGRLSAKKPAFQTIPKHHPWAKRIRRCYVAPPGYVMLERDYSQGELRVIACIANEDNMIAAYKNGRDLHSETAGPFNGYSYEKMMEMKKSPDKVLQEIFKETRQLGKAGNFGLVYGMSWTGFQIYAAENYGVSLSDEDAQKFRLDFFKRYPKLSTYHDVYKDFAHRHGYVCSPLGRVRHLPLINTPVKEVRAKEERRAINSPVQGCLSDLMLWSLAIENQMGISQIAPCFGVVHDSAMNYCLEDKVDVVLPQILDVMENLPFEKVGWQPQLKFIADASYGYNMGELIEYKRPKGAASC